MNVMSINYEVRHDMKKKLRKDKVEFISS
jgi:hypothetical protein